MKNKIEIKRNLDGYYIFINGMANDDDIINYLGITDELYFKKGIEFGGKNIEERALYFYYKSNANFFAEWIEKNIDAFLVAKALTNQ